MSQKSEKYARAMERRVSRLEETVESIAFDVTAQGVRLDIAEGTVEGIARSAEREVIAARKERRADRRRWRRVVSLVLTALAITLLAVAVTKTGAAAEPEYAQAALTAAHDMAVAITDLWGDRGKEPPELAEIKSDLLARCRLSDAVPLPYSLQSIMRAACTEYGCPYPFALAVAERESQFEPEAVGAVGEVGIMQLNPGPDGSYHAALEADTGWDPTTPTGNIICGVYLLGKYITAYGDPAKAAMAYNMGEAQAREVWAAGVTSTEYATAVLSSMEDWGETVSAWDGI